MQSIWDKYKGWGIGIAVALLVAGVVYAMARPAQAEGVGPPIPGIMGVTDATPGSWTSLYLGGGVGYQVGDTNVSLDCGDCGGEGYNLGTLNGLSSRGWGADVRAGFDYQFPGTAFVVGALGGYGWGNAESSLTAFDGDVTASAKLEQKWYAGGRLGVILFSNTLGYVGYAWTQGDVSGSLTDGETISAGKTIDGQMLLAGLEHRLSPTWTIGAEYSLTRWEDICAEIGGHALSFDPDVHAFKARLNWRPFAK